jgi:protein-tyrosine-phosphatase
MGTADTIRLDFLCVANAGRSQMAAAFAERERAERDLEDVVEIYSAGTDPAEAVHEEVVEAMAEVGIDVSGRRPRYVDLEQLKESHYLVTMGCTITEFNPARYGVESRAWDLTNPDGQDMETVREVRDEVERRVETLFDEIEATAGDQSTDPSLPERVTSAVKDTLSF